MLPGPGRGAQLRVVGPALDPAPFRVRLRLGAAVRAAAHGEELPALRRAPGRGQPGVGAAADGPAFGGGAVEDGIPGDRRVAGGAGRRRDRARPVGGPAAAGYFLYFWASLRRFWARSRA